jgi:hypothetical protein
LPEDGWREGVRQIVPMTSTDERIGEIRRRINQAFADAAAPTGSVIEHNCEECFALETTFANRKWQEIDLEVVEKNFSNLPLFSPEAFHYFLPAYLLHALEPAELNGSVMEFTIYALSPNKEIEHDPSRLKWWRRRFASFSSEQLQLIYDFFDLAATDEHFSIDKTLIERGKERLKRYMGTRTRKY